MKKTRSWSPHFHGAAVILYLLSEKAVLQLKYYYILMLQVTTLFLFDTDIAGDTTLS